MSSDVTDVTGVGVVMPDVPTMREQGFPELEVETWYGVFAPAGTPAAVIATLNADFDALLQDAQMR